MSFMYVKKANGPNIDRWSTPVETANTFDVMPFISTYYDISVRQLSNHESSVLLTPQYFNLFNNILWSKVSKDLHRSMQIAI